MTNEEAYARCRAAAQAAERAGCKTADDIWAHMQECAEYDDGLLYAMSVMAVFQGCTRTLQ